jgi:hypothetical protein
MIRVLKCDLSLKEIGPGKSQDTFFNGVPKARMSLK